jgi:N-acetylmuramoyl-L-alanine amidase
MLGSALSSQTPSASQLTILSKEGRRTLATVTAGGQELVALDEVAARFQLTVHEETLGSLTVSYKGKTIVLTPEQTLASVAGRLVSLPAPPTRSGRRWLVPVEFLSRALGPIYDSRLDLRKPSHLLVVGDLRVPKITARYEPLGSSGRLTIDAAPRTSSTVSQENDRLTIRFDADALDVPGPLLAPQPPTSLVQTLRVVEPSTVVAELAPKTSLRSTTQPADNATHVVIDLTAASTTDQPSPAAGQPSTAPGQPPAAGQPTPAPAPPELPPAFVPGTQAPGLRTLVIDPGHGGEDEGVKGAGGAKEKDLALAVAKRLKSAVEARLGIRVLLTRDDDRNVPLDDRSALANNNKADLFISLHANASFRKATAGLVIFTASFDGGDGQTEAKPFASERLPAFGGGLREIDLVPWNLAQSGHLQQSATFAKILQQLLQGRVPLAAAPLDRAPLRVLEAANMPAVLVEMGYLSNAEQEALLAKPEFQTTFTQTALEAIVRFRDLQSNGATQ